MRPEFIGIGGERCGTSWIYSCLAEHPQLCMPFKAVNFFHRQDHFQRGIEWYEGHFKTCAPAKLVGEITTAYLYSPEAPRRIQEYHSQVKLFVSLRNPVDRALSHYQNELMGGIIDDSLAFDQAVAARPVILERSRYAEALSRYLSCFPSERLLVLVYEDALADAEAFLGRIFRFLGVDEAFRPSMTHARVNEGGVPRSPRVDRGLDWAGDAMRRLRMQGVLLAMKKCGVTGLVRRANIRSRQAALSSEQRSRLLALFEPDVRQVERIIGRDLSIWRA